MNGHTDGQRENSISPTNTVCGVFVGYNKNKNSTMTLATLTVKKQTNKKKKKQKKTKTKKNSTVFQLLTSVFWRYFVIVAIPR